MTGRSAAPRWYRWVPAAAAVVAGLTMGSPARADAIPTATPVPAGIRAVGPVFPAGVGSAHECTGAVVRTARANLVLTAAHCLTGSGTGVQFVPGYHAGVAPVGVWNVTAVYVDPRWVATQDPQNDNAVMAVVPTGHDGRRTARLSDLVAGYTIGLAPSPGRPIEVPAYAEGIDDVPFTCTASTYYSTGFPTFDCHGYVTGTSGAPWLTPDRDGTRVVRGVIGGLHQGGCVEYTSYSSRFTPAVLTLLARATHGGPTDVLPTPGGDGCDTLLPNAKTTTPAPNR
jgi:hypothetical protein